MAETDFLSVQVTDENGNVGTIVVHVPTGSTVAQIQSYANSFIVAVDKITGAKVTGATVNFALALPGGLKASATAGEPLQQGANFGFDAANTDYRHTVRVPAIAEDHLVGELVDQTDQDIIDWLLLMNTGNGVVAPSDRFGNDLTSLLAARVTFRKQ